VSQAEGSTKTMAARRIVHIEIPGADNQALGAFYQNTFGWNVNLDATFNYLQFSTGGETNGAFVPNSGDMWAGTGPNSPIFYLGTDDIAGDLAKVEAAGCRLLVPKMEIPGVGWMGMFVDPAGNHVGLFEYLPTQG
ncbi:MAG TPA: VOC family protein, partial [Chloroflexia bacterium]|nr:VOC family protein [Chloroflexia bacterium]